MMGNSHLHEEFDGTDLSIQARRFEQFVADGADRVFFIDVMTIDELFEYYKEEDQAEQALRLMEFAVRTHPYISEFYYKKAMVESVLGKFNDAYDSAQEALNLKPENTDYLILKSKILTHLEQYTLAIEILYQALELSKEPAEIYKEIGSLNLVLGKTKNSVSFFAQALAIDPAKEEILYDITEAYESEDDIPGAIRFCLNFIDDHPYSFHAWYNLGLLYLKQGLFEKAIDSFDYAIITDDKLVCGYQAKARCYMEMDKPELAIPVLLESLFYEKNNGITLTSLGECYEELDNPVRARHYYNECAKYHPEAPYALLGIASTFETEDNFLSAIHYYKAALELDTEYYDAWAGLAECEFLMGNKTAAYDALTNALVYHTDDVDFWTDWAERLDEDDNLSGALVMLEEGIKLMPKESSLYYTFAAYLFKAGRTREAYQYLENALLLDFNGHTLLYQLCPQVARLRPIQEIIEQYRPR